MKDLTPRELDVRLKCAMESRWEPVGIRFLFTGDEYDQAVAKPLTKPIHYCRMVRGAACGNAIKASAAMHGCSAAARALGLTEASELVRSGRRWQQLQLYHDLNTAKHTIDRQQCCDHQAYGVMVKPLSSYNDNEEPPHVVQIVTVPYYAMRLVQGYTYYYGMDAKFEAAGLQAVCSESTAVPYMKNRLNVSVLCGGTRRWCRWGDDEMDVSIPYSRFALTVEGLLRTMNLQDNNMRKEAARTKLREAGLEAEYPLQDDYHYCDIPYPPNES